LTDPQGPPAWPTPQVGPTYVGRTLIESGELNSPGFTPGNLSGWVTEWHETESRPLAFRLEDGPRAAKRWSV